MKFKVGDEVRYIYDYPCGAGQYIPYGACGVVKAIEEPLFAIEFDSGVKGHCCGGYARAGHGWWLISKHLEHTETFEGNV